MDQREFLDIILPIKDSLYRLAKSYLISNDEAQDAVQEVFLKLWKNKESINNYNIIKNNKYNNYNDFNCLYNELINFLKLSGDCLDIDIKIMYVNNVAIMAAKGSNKPNYIIPIQQGYPSSITSLLLLIAYSEIFQSPN